MPGALLAALFESEDRYGWSIGMRAVTHAILDAMPLPAGPLLEVGIGGGALLSELTTHHPQRAIFGMDVHGGALAHAHRKTDPLARASANQLPYRSQSIAGIVALDVLDQRTIDPCSALAECHRVLLPDGRLLLRVSAHPWLHGPHDSAFGTAERFSIGRLVRALDAAHFEVTRLTYANLLLAPAAIVQRLLQRYGLLPTAQELNTRAWVNQTVAWLLHGEAQWLRTHDLAFGMSLYAVARKRPEARL